MTFSKTCLTVSCVLLSVGLLSPASQAGEVIHSYVDYDADHYLLNLQMRIAAPVARVFPILLDFNAIKELNDSFKVSRLLAKHGNHYTVLLISEGCIWFFCRRIKQVQLVTDLGDGYLRSITDPAQSDMVSGKVLWHVRADPESAQQTLISYRADFEPDFFIPPLIGPWLMKKSLLREGQQTVNAIEQRAQQLDRQ